MAAFRSLLDSESDLSSSDEDMPMVIPSRKDHLCNLEDTSSLSGSASTKVIPMQEHSDRHEAGPSNGSISLPPSSPVLEEHDIPDSIADGNEALFDGDIDNPYNSENFYLPPSVLHDAFDFS